MGKKQLLEIESIIAKYDKRRKIKKISFIAVGILISVVFLILNNLPDIEVTFFTVKINYSTLVGGTSGTLIFYSTLLSRNSYIEKIKKEIRDKGDS